MFLRKPWHIFALLGLTIVVGSGCSPMMIAEQLAGQALGIPPAVTGKAFDTAEAIINKTANAVEESTKRQVQINEQKAVADANKRLTDYLEGKSSYGGDPKVEEYVSYNAKPTNTFASTNTKKSSSTNSKKHRTTKKRDKTRYYSNGSSGGSSRGSHSTWGGSHSTLY